MTQVSYSLLTLIMDLPQNLKVYEPHSCNASNSSREADKWAQFIISGFNQSELNYMVSLKRFAFVCICLYTSTGVFTTTNHQLGCCVLAPLCIPAGTAKSQFQLVLNCSNETTFEQLKILNVATSVSGMFCMLVAIVIFVILVHYKVYNTPCSDCSCF